MERRALLVSSAALLAAVAVPTGAMAEPRLATTPSNSDIDDAQIPAFAGGKKSGVVTDTYEVEGEGVYSIEMNLDTGEGVITAPDGSTKAVDGESLATQAQEYLERGQSEGKTVAAPTGGMQTMGLKEDVCPYLVGAIAGGHAAAWRAALVLVGANPAIGIVMGLGYGAFWIWVSTNCPS